MLREIEAYNQSPEAEDRLDSGLTREQEGEFCDTPLTRGARKSLVRVAKNGSLTPRKSMNVKTLMRAELSGAGKGTKRANVEDTIDLSPSKKQRKEMMDLGFGSEEDDGEEVVPNASSRQPTLRQVGKVAGNGQGNDESSAESAWLTWDSRKG